MCTYLVVESIRNTPTLLRAQNSEKSYVWIPKSFGLSDSEPITMEYAQPHEH